MSSEAAPRSEGAVIVSTGWLEEHLADRNLRVVDVRGLVRPPGQNPRYVAKRAEYEAGHIPGAVFADWTRDIVDIDDPVPVQIAKADAFAARMGELGIGDDTLVVTYDDYDHVFAGRFAWALRYYGHDRTRILDGGFTRWVGEKRPVSHDDVRPAGARFTPHVRPELRRTADELMAVLDMPDVAIIDARAPEQYSGRTSPAKRGGHIPGARNVHYATLIDPETKCFLPRADLANVFAAAGVDVRTLPRNVVVYCNGGVTCTVPLNALRLLGRDDVAVYDGSWNEWGNDANRPIKDGVEP